MWVGKASGRIGVEAAFLGVEQMLQRVNHRLAWRIVNDVCRIMTDAEFDLYMLDYCIISKRGN